MTQPAQPKANFFLVGAAKSGTTALCNYLREHPNVFITVPKEPHFFATDFPNYRPIHEAQQYQGLFDSVQTQHMAIGESSNTYLMSEQAAANVAAYNPDARILALLRNPIDMVYSAHAQYLHLRDETEADFERAWQLLPARKQGFELPRSNRDPKVVYYDQIAKYHTQLVRWYEQFPQAQIKVVLFDDFIEDTRREYVGILRFLDLPVIEPDTFPRANENRSHRNRLLGHLSMRPPGMAVRAVERAKALLGIERLGVLNKVRTWNDRVAPRAPMSDEIRAAITREYHTDVEALSELLDRDLVKLWLTAT